MIEAKIGDADGYQIVGRSINHSFKHTGVQPGVSVRYRVRSQARRAGVSDWSNEAEQFTKDDAGMKAAEKIKAARNIPGSSFPARELS